MTIDWIGLTWQSHSLAMRDERTRHSLRMFFKVNLSLWTTPRFHVSMGVSTNAVRSYDIAVPATSRERCLFVKQLRSVSIYIFFECPVLVKHASRFGAIDFKMYYGIIFPPLGHSYSIPLSLSLSLWLPQYSHTCCMFSENIHSYGSFLTTFILYASLLPWPTSARVPIFFSFFFYKISLQTYLRQPSITV